MSQGRIFIKNYKESIYDEKNVSLYAILSGILMGIGIANCIPVLGFQLGVYLLNLGIFHYLEYIITAIYNPTRVRLSCNCFIYCFSIFI